MNIKYIENIVWYIPFKKLRNSIRNYFYDIIEMKKEIKNLSFFTNTDVYPWEYEIIKEFRKSIENDKNCIEKYKKLISNLDDESKILIHNILNKITNYNSIEDKIYFNSDELYVINKNNYDHNSKIIKFNKDLYLYENYFLPIKHFGMDVFYDKYGLYHLKNLDYFRDKDIIDAGAYIGDTAIMLSDYTNKNVYSFEPFINNYNLMLKTIDLNNKKNIIPVHKALGNKNEEISIFSNGVSSSALSIENDNKAYKEEKVEIVTLDEFVKENNIKVGLIKTDLEGFEQEFLNGALNTIKEQKPTLLISIYHNYNDFFNIKPFLEELNLGYKFKIIKTQTFYALVTALLIAEPY